MVRTQLQIDETTYEELRKVAHRQRASISAVVRDILHEHLNIQDKKEPVTLSFIGAGSSGRHDISIRHDEALTEDFQ